MRQYENCLSWPELVKASVEKAVLTKEHGWTARAPKVPEGKFLQGIFCNPGGVRIIAMAAKGS